VTKIPLLLAAALYIWAAVGFLVKGNLAYFVAFIGYAVANVAFAWRM